MGLNPSQFRTYVINPTLMRLSLYSPAASNLLLGTALQESGLIYIHQLGAGPALGVFQMESATAADITENYLPAHPQLFARIIGLKAPGMSDDEHLMANLAYATAMCRVHYLRDPTSLPDAMDALGMAETWKRVYNTPAGAGTVEQALPHFETAIAA